MKNTVSRSVLVAMYCLLLGSTALYGESTGTCTVYKNYCGPHLDMSSCQSCCARQFPTQQEQCVRWCFEGVIPKKH